MAIHRIFLESINPGPLTVEGDEAHHAARVKRLAEGDPVQVLDGWGSIGEARIVSISKPRGEWRLELDVARLWQEPPASPRLEVYCPAPKGPRLAEMIDGLSQIGAAQWSPLETERTVTEPRAGKLERLDRTAWEAAKQCGRAWVLEIGPAVSMMDVLAGPEPVVIADASGGPYAPSGQCRVRLLLGPEGGWSQRELEQARSAGAMVARFGPHTMRIETASVAATAIMLDAEARWDGSRK